MDSAAIRVWDLPTRVFHWCLALSVIGAFISVKIGGNAMIWHARFGYCALALILFRVIWGFIGPVHARFANFVKGPRKVLASLRGEPWNGVGHNPLGALSVIVLIVVFGVQAGLGLFTTDEIAFDGPLVKRVGSDWAAFATRWHNRSEWLLIGLVILHIGAIVVHRVVRRHDLVRPMITGDVHVATSVTVESARDDLMVRVKAIVVMTLAASLVAYLSL